MTRKFDIYDRVFKFATRIKKMHLSLIGDRTISRKALNQVLDSSSSIGANLEEANGAHSRADFHAKLRIALKEARETHYWLRYIAEPSESLSRRLASLIGEGNEIVAILTTIAKQTNPRNADKPNS